jgi:hypothetical protein
MDPATVAHSLAAAHADRLEALVPLADRQARDAAQLHEVAGRVAAVARRGEAVVGFIEYLPPEAEGERNWLVGVEESPPHAS